MGGGAWRQEDGVREPSSGGMCFQQSINGTGTKRGKGGGGGGRFFLKDQQTDRQTDGEDGWMDG
jgi:hypothetical protein